VRTRGAGEVCQTPRENQQQRPESRHEKGGIQQTMPVSLPVPLRPARAISLSGKRPLLFVAFTCSMRRTASVQLAMTLRFVENFVTGFFFPLLPFLPLRSYSLRSGATGNFSLATRLRKREREMPRCFLPPSHSVSILRTSENPRAFTPRAATPRRA